MAANATLAAPATTNVAGAERIGSTIAGTLLVLRALARPSLARIVVAVGGVALLQRGLTGHCAFYERLGLSTAASQPRVKDPVTCASEDSFPASDPPSWTPVVGEGVARV